MILSTLSLITVLPGLQLLILTSDVIGYDFMERHIGICYRSGDSTFWWENWTQSGRLSDHALGDALLEHGALTISDVALADSWGSTLLSYLIPSNLTDIITTYSPCLCTGPDEYIWDLEATGAVLY